MNTKSILRSEAVVLRSVEYGETSEIVTFFTRQHGKVTGITKGSRNVKSRFGSTLQPMSYIDLVYYFRPTRSVQTVTETAHVRRFENLGRDLTKITVGLRCIELTNAMMIEGDAYPDVFQSLVDCLEAINSQHARPENILPYFQLRVADGLGFTPSFEKSQIEAVPDRGGSLYLPDGSVGPVNIGREFRAASRSALRAFAVFSRSTLDTAARMDVRPEDAQQVQNLIESYFRYHVETQYPTRASRVTGQLFDVGKGKR